MRRTLVAGAALVLPFAATVATLSLLVPSRLEGRGGALAWFARVGVEQPLLLGLGLFLAFAAVTRYWLRRVEGDVARPTGSSRAFVAWAVGLVALAWFVRARVVEVHRVVGASMTPTLRTGDRLLVDKRAYGLRLPFSSRVVGARLPARGDVVVFTSEGGGHQALVKRVLGLPGDVVGYRDGVPNVNGSPVPSCDAGAFFVVSNGTTVPARLVVEVLDGRAYLAVRSPSDESRLEPLRVPPGKVFVLGDDRPASDDSRSALGAVPVDAIHGRVDRLAFASARDGRLDLLHPFTRLGPVLREGNVDVRKLEAGIAACLAKLSI